MSSAYASYNANYGTTLTKPYLTLAEFQNAPTALDLSNLLPGGSQTSQDAALVETIARASSIIDQECLGAWGTLNATSDVENGRVWASPDGSLRVHPKYWPILEVSAFSYGLTPTTSGSVDCASSVWIEPQAFVVQPSGVVGLGLGSLAGTVGRQPYYCTWTYVNGFVNTTLAASVAAGATQITLTDVAGVYPGSSLTLLDLPYDEQVTVASTYTPGQTTVPLASPLTYGHTSATATNLPRAAKQAAISLTTALVKIRGSGALTVNSLNEVQEYATTNPMGALDDVDACLWAIRGLRQMYVGT